MAEAPQQGGGDGGVTLVEVYGDLRELSGDVRARLDGVERTNLQVLEELRAMHANGSGIAAKVANLEAAALPLRVTSLETRWRVAAMIGTAVALMVAGLFADLLRSLMFGS